MVILELVQTKAAEATAAAGYMGKKMKYEQIETRWQVTGY
jgi:hypothetical protein